MIAEEIVRRERLEALGKQGIEAYPAQAERSHHIGEVLAQFDELEAATTPVSLVGRVRSIRKHGGVTFVTLQDESGSLQMVLHRDTVGESVYEAFHAQANVGDFYEFHGPIFKTQKGERSLKVESSKILAKALLPLPEKWHGLTDTEMRYRHRELDLISNPDARWRFVVRSKLVSSLRSFLDEKGFLEVETPILQAIPGGANARPFVTHHNALDADLYLRIAPELYLKRLIIGGFEKVYEIGRSFRNEGIDYAHNPEFTSIELYWAYTESKDKFVDFLERIMRHIIQNSVGSLAVKYEDGEIDFGADWHRHTFREAIIAACGIDIDEFRDPEALINEVVKKNLKIDFKGCVGIGEHYDQLFKKTAREKIKQPTWIFDYPIELKPLAKASPDDPTKSASAQLVVQGAEIINAYYHELNNPIDQRQRFEDQQTLREQGSEEAQQLDEEFLFALAHGMPPTSGMAIGIDRLVAFLTNAPNLKEVILFPTLKPEVADESTEL